MQSSALVVVARRLVLPCLFLGALAMAVACAGGGDENPADARGSGDSAGGQCSFCPAGEECCGGFCTNVQSSRQHCGECNNACLFPTSNTCALGSCGCNFGPPCSGGQECCEGIGCADTMTDNDNCGGCGMACGANETCVAGACVCAATGGECMAGEMCCSAGCVNTATDVANCGMCDNACPGGGTATCDNGTCGCGACPATPVPACCGDGCVDLCNDPNNCGECGKVCSGCTLGGCDDDPLPFPDPNCLLPP